MPVKTLFNFLSLFILTSFALSSLVYSFQFDDHFAEGDEVQFEFLGDTYQGTVVEVDSLGWLEVEFEHRGRTKERKFPPGRVRLVESESQNPFADNNSEQAPLREWTDSTGKFKVKARLVVNIDGRVELKKEDDRIVTLPLKKLSEDDQKYLAKLSLEKAKESDPENPFSGGVPNSKRKDRKPSRRNSEPEFGKEVADSDKDNRVSPELGTNKVRLISSRWDYSPDSAETMDALPSIPFETGLSSRSRIQRTKPLVLSQDKSTAATIVYDPFNKKKSAVVLFNLNEASTKVSLEIPKANVKILAVSNDGENFVTASDSSRESGMSFWKIKNDGVTLQETWKTAEFGDRNGFEPESGIFLGNGRLLTIGKNVVMWETESKADLYTITDVSRDSVAFSANNKYFSVCVDGEIHVVEVRSGKSCGKIKTKHSLVRTAFSQSGQFLAVAESGTGSIDIWDLGNQELIREISLQKTAYSIDWVGDEFILLNGSELLDIASRVTVWKYTGISRDDLTTSQDGRFWVVDNGLLNAVRIPHRDLSDKIEQLDPDSLLVFEPGDEVQLEIQVPFSTSEMSSIREHFTKQLSNNGISVRDDAEIKIIAKVVKLKKESMELSNMMGPMFRRNTETIVFSPSKATVIIEKNGEEIWSRSRTYKPVGVLHIQNGETSQTAADRVCRPKKSFFTSLEFPRTVSRMPGGKPLGQSRLK